MFRIVGTVGCDSIIRGWVRQVPTFHLDGDLHGLTDPESAARFARRFLEDLAGPETVARVDVVAE